ncbi:unnamed protein product [Trichogramma brassicae]|uniref:Uncharacterized protein n=1 Tax=Trichogramma brassicae TaxID=86971 RepID=A0A6H5IM63_9HYME|nr:unnamed protein product [Trichogramma brassicae]
MPPNPEFLSRSECVIVELYIIMLVITISDDSEPWNIASEYGGSFQEGQIIDESFFEDSSNHNDDYMNSLESDHSNIFFEILTNSTQEDEIQPEQPIENNDLAAFAYAVRGQQRSGLLHDNWNKIRNSAGKYQRSHAIQLLELSRVVVPEEGCGFEEIDQFQKYFAEQNTAIVVYAFTEFGRGQPPIYNDSIIYVTRDDDVEKLETGSMLGQLTDELASYGEESVERLRYAATTPTVKSVQTLGTPLERLDGEMSNILQGDYSDEREKCRSYQQVLQRYLQLKDTDAKKKIDEKKSDSSDTGDVGDAADDDTPETSEPKKKIPDSFDRMIVESVPARSRNNTKHLLNWLRRDGNISWSDKGVVTIDGSLVTGNMLDLVNEMMRSRKASPTAGTSQFADALRRVGTPSAFIDNKQYRRFIAEPTRFGDTEEETSSNSSPEAKSGGKRKRQKGDLTYIESENTTPRRPRSGVAAPGVTVKKWMRLSTPR